MIFPEFQVEWGCMIGYAEAILQEPKHKRAMNLLCRLADGIPRKKIPKESIILTQLGMANTYLNGEYEISLGGIYLVYHTCRLKVKA